MISESDSNRAPPGCRACGSRSGAPSEDGGRDDARLLCESRALADWFEQAAARHGGGAELAKWLRRDVLRVLSDQGLTLEASPLAPEALADLLQLVARGVTTAASARSLLPELLREGGDPERMVRERGLQAVSDAGPIEAAVDAVLAEHPEHVARLRGGEEKVRNFLIGQVMKRTGGKADPATVRRVLDGRMAAAMKDCAVRAGWPRSSPALRRAGGGAEEHRRSDGCARASSQRAGRDRPRAALRAPRGRSFPPA